MMKPIFYLLVLVSAVAARGRDIPAPCFNSGERILFQGDSITDGNRGRTADPNHILGHGYAFLIAAKCGAAYPERHLTFINRGISGNRVADLASRWQADAIDLQPDVISILIGVNDVLISFDQHQTVSVEDFRQKYDQLLATTMAARPKAKLILGDPFILPGRITSPRWADWQATIRQLQAVVASLGEKYHAPVVHFQKVFDAAARLGQADDYWIWDGVHPTYSGHQLMADEWMRAYHQFYGSPLLDPERNSAIDPVPKLENDSYDWYARHAEVLDWQRRMQPEIVLIGDSITHFWAGPPTAKRQSGPQAWAQTFGDRPVLNLGFGWDRTQNVLWRLNHGEMDGLAPRMIVLNIGCNNFSTTASAHANTPEEVSAAIQVIVQRLHVKSPSSRIIVMGLFPRGAAPSDPTRALHARVNALLASTLVDKPWITFLEIGGKFLATDGTLSKDVFFDGTHPAEKGYAIWGEALRNAGLTTGSSGQDVSKVK